MLAVGYVALVVTMLLCAVAAVLIKSLIWSAVALGMGSASLAMLLSVGAGLISILFIVAISLTESLRSRSSGR